MMLPNGRPAPAATSDGAYFFDVARDLTRIIPALESEVRNDRRALASACRSQGSGVA